MHTSPDFPTLLRNSVTIASSLVTSLRNMFGEKIIGVKDSSGSAASTEAFLRQHSDIAILVDDERQLAQSVATGGQGSICGVANLYPQTLKNLINDAAPDNLLCALYSFQDTSA